MKVTATEHSDALTACAIIRRAFEGKEITPEADDDLVALNRLAGAHACNEHITAATHDRAMRAMRGWQSFTEGEIPPYEVEDETGGIIRVRTGSGKQYAVTHDGAMFRRGHFQGRTLAEAMRGAV